MRVLDPRLYQRARAVRTLLVVDSVLAVVVALLVLAQAFLLARVAARAFGGSSLDDVAPALVLLGLVVIARAAGAWGFEVAGRRAAAEVVSQLRLDVVDARLRRRPAALDGTQTSEVTTAAVTGVDALEATFARYLPQVVLAAVVPIAVLAIVVSIDPLAAGVMVLTLPLVPVFMWLVGRQTARKARERWQALALLSNHFLDVVRGLPTLRAFNRGAVQAERIASVSDEYRTDDDGDAAARVPVRRDPGARGDARDRARRRRRGGSARGREHRLRGGADRARARLLSSTCRSGTSRPSGTRAPTAPPSQSDCSTSSEAPAVAVESRSASECGARADRVRAGLVPVPDA